MIIFLHIYTKNRPQQKKIKESEKKQKIYLLQYLCKSFHSYPDKIDDWGMYFSKVKCNWVFNNKIMQYEYPILFACVYWDKTAVFIMKPRFNANSKIDFEVQDNKLQILEQTFDLDKSQSFNLDEKNFVLLLKKILKKNIHIVAITKKKNIINSFTFVGEYLNKSYNIICRLNQPSTILLNKYPSPQLKIGDNFNFDLPAIFAKKQIQKNTYEIIVCISQPHTYASCFTSVEENKKNKAQEENPQDENFEFVKSLEELNLPFYFLILRVENNIITKFTNLYQDCINIKKDAKSKNNKINKQ